LQETALADENTSGSRKKRRLRAPSETVREKAVKAQETAALPTKPTKKRRVARFLALPFRGLAWLGHRPPLKQVGHGLRWFFSLRFMRFIGRVLGFTYVRDSWRELRGVTWPNRTQSRQLTFAVIIFSVIFGGLIAIVDLGLNKLFKEVLLK
jgi:preprotein translocase SecE subunit